MVSRVRYPHLGAYLFRRRARFVQLVVLVFAGLLLTAAPVPLLFVAALGYVAWGLAGSRAHRTQEVALPEEP
jgi:phosphatidylserine synthase